MGKRTVRRVKKHDPKKGDRVRMLWVDITTCPTSAPEEVKPTPFTTEGFYLGEQLFEYGEHRIRYHLMSDTFDHIDQVFYGATAYPVGCVLKLEVIGK